MSKPRKPSASSRTIGLFTGATEEEDAKRMAEEELVSTRKSKVKGYNVESDVTWYVLHPREPYPYTVATVAKHERGVVINIARSTVPGSERPEDLVASHTISLTQPEFLAMKRIFDTW